ncbi:MAG TPA: hypothetical protein VE621_00095, partial [Bryobacteraceae bacterium]|nr:hypothetical protein [Bryobacteraceae bacterium]
MIRVVGALFALLAVWPCVGVETEIWVQNELADFEKGTLKKLSVRSDGRLLLAPVFEQIVDTSIPYLWAIAGDGKGTLFVAGGGQGSTSAQILAIDATGKHRVYADVPGMQVQALAVDRNGTLFAGTSPDGKVYRVTPGKAEVFYDPKAKYIWAMGFNSKGDLYVATGDGGEVHRVAPNGQGSVFFRTEETHARSLAIDPKDNIIVGTEPSGLILRVAPNGEGFVVYQSAKREVTAVAVGKDGLIYAAAVGNRSGRSEPSQLSVPPLPIPSASIARPAGGAAPTVATAQPTGPQPPGSQPAGAPVPGGSEFYRIESDGFPRKLWSHPQEIIYAVGFDANGVPILATGNKGKLFRVDSENVWTLLIDAETTQITALHRTPDGRLYAATGNIGKVFRVGPGLEKTGSYESEAYDAGSFSYWGRVATKGAATIETRSGNLERTSTNWSPWAPLNGDRIASPPARFLQYR